MDIPLLMGQILAFCCIALGGILIQRVTQLDITLASLLSGVIAGLLIPWLGLDIGLRANDVHDLVFYILLPLLIFIASWHINPVILRRWLAPSLILASVGVLISAGIMTVGIYFGIGHATGFPWIAALLTGAILSATDPIAVVAKLHQLKAPEDLSTLFEGESLFNDATAVVLFSVVLLIAQGKASPESISVYFVGIFFGGIAVGLVCGLLAALAVSYIRQSSASTIIFLVGAFGSFYIAEHLVHVSGIMSVMVTAVFARSRLKEKDQPYLEGIGLTWNWLELFLNALLFSLMGLVITFEMFQEQWLAMIIAIAVASVSRFASVYICTALSHLTTQPISAKWALILSWGGLRGGIAIALALSLPITLDYWWTIQSMVFAVVLFTLLVQGTTTGRLIGKLGVH